MSGEHGLLKVVFATLLICPMQQLVGVECVVHLKSIGKIEIEP